MHQVLEFEIKEHELRIECGLASAAHLDQSVTRTPALNPYP